MNCGTRYCHMLTSLFFNGTFIIAVSAISCNKEDPNFEQHTENDTLVRYAPVEVTKENPMHLYAHYMPWFDDKSTSANGSWGMHWTMATRNPDVIDSAGKREIASHFYPLIGPYASSDPDVIEYHLLLMKYAGIEGVLFDWYGSTDLYDYPEIRRNTEAMIAKISETGLKFAVVYEDRTITAAMDQDPELDPVLAAQDDIIYLGDNYFNHPAYIQIDGKPLLMVFGPERFHNPDEWGEIFSALFDQPLFLVLNGKSFETSPVSSGEYIWVDNTSLDSKYGTMNIFDYFMGGAYPGFLDYYLEGGWGAGFSWHIEFNNGQTLHDNLMKAQNYGVDYLQLITWNDFGEGTMIEPSLEFGYSLLEEIQSFAGVNYSQNELTAIHQLYSLRNESSSIPDYQSLLSQSFYYFVSLQSEKAMSLLDSLETIQTNYTGK